jgi:fucose permease
VSFCSSVLQLSVPHFGVGLGIGIVDATVVPLMAKLVDEASEGARYGPVYALQQAAVCLAYFFGNKYNSYCKIIDKSRGLIVVIILEKKCVIERDM